MIYYPYDEFLKDAKALALQIQAKFSPDGLLCIARGGLTLGHFLGIALKTRNVFSLNSIHYDDTQKLELVKVFNIPDLSTYKRILIVDDIIDSGETLAEIKRILSEKFPHIDFKIATIFYKKTALLSPDFGVKEARDWIEFFWDISI